MFSWLLSQQLAGSGHSPSLSPLKGLGSATTERQPKWLMLLTGRNCAWHFTGIMSFYLFSHPANQDLFEHQLCAGCWGCAVNQTRVSLFQELAVQCGGVALPPCAGKGKKSRGGRVKHPWSGQGRELRPSRVS